MIANIDSYLSNFSEKLSQFQKLDAAFKRQLDSELAFHFQVINWREASLVVVTDSAAWATRLRYLTPELIKLLQADMPGLEKIHILIRPQDSLNGQQQSNEMKYQLSSTSSQVLAETAQSIENPILKEALLSLAAFNKK